jgi:hypothetical protein
VDLLQVKLDRVGLLGILEMLEMLIWPDELVCNASLGGGKISVMHTTCLTKC